MTDSLTEVIAASAARLVVETGLEYGAAKHKAARALGRRGGGPRVELPSNVQVEDEVRADIELFLGRASLFFGDGGGEPPVRRGCAT